MYHSITFTDKSEDELNAGSFTPTSTGLLLNGVNTWDEWHLIPSSRPDIAMPGVSEKFLEIPGRDGSIDLSEWLAGRVTYSDREGSLEFYHQNGYEDYETVRRAMAMYFHGRVLKMVLEDDPGYYYQGRFKFNGWKSDPSHSKVVIDYRLAPYKWDVLPRIKPTDWPFDTFSVDRDYDYWFHVPELPTEGNVVYKAGQFVKYKDSVYRFTSAYSGVWSNALSHAVVVPTYFSYIAYSTGDYVVDKGCVWQKTSSGWNPVVNSYFYWYDVPTYKSTKSYMPGEIVKYNGKLYCFLHPYNPTVDAWDEDYWIEVLRSYGSNKESYYAGELVTYNNKIYQFNRDYGAPIWQDSWWTKIPYYDEYQQYYTGDNVIYNGDVYQFNRDYGQRVWNDAWWIKVSNYSDNEYYAAGQYVLYNGAIYSFNVGYIGGDAWDPSYWTVVVPAYETPGHAYHTGDYVMYKNNIYKFTHDYTSGQEWNDSWWESAKIYSDYDVYPAGEFVWYNGNWYKFTVNYTGPLAWDDSWWTNKASIASIAEYSSKNSYHAGDYVLYKGDYYKFNVDYAGEDYWDDSYWTEISTPVIGQLDIKGYKVLRMQASFGNRHGFMSAYKNTNYGYGAHITPVFYNTTGQDMNDEIQVFVVGEPDGLVFRGGQL